MLGGLVGLFIATFAIVTLARNFIDIDTLDRKIIQPNFKVTKIILNLKFYIPISIVLYTIGW